MSRAKSGLMAAILLAAALGFCAFLIVKTAKAAPAPPPLNAWAPPAGLLVESQAGESFIAHRYRTKQSISQVSAHFRRLNGLGGDPAFYGFGSSLFGIIKRSSARAALSLGSLTNAEVILSRDKRGCTILQSCALPDGNGTEVLVVGVGLRGRGDWTKLSAEPFPDARQQSAGMASGIKAARFSTDAPFRQVHERCASQAAFSPGHTEPAIYYADDKGAGRRLMLTSDGAHSLIVRFDAATLQTIHVAQHTTNTFFVRASMGNP